jgi:hypothetical protein
MHGNASIGIWNMGAHAQTIGLPFSGKNRRSERDRRVRMDPRYRNPAYPQFHDRRKRDRRKPTYEDVSPFVQEHPERKWILIISVLVVIFLTYVFFFTNLIATNRGLQEKRQQGTIVLGQDLVNDIKGMSKKGLTSIGGFSKLA